MPLEKNSKLKKIAKRESFHSLGLRLTFEDKSYISASLSYNGWSRISASGNTSDKAFDNFDKQLFNYKWMKGVNASVYVDKVITLLNSKIKTKTDLETFSL